MCARILPVPISRVCIIIYMLYCSIHGSGVRACMNSPVRIDAVARCEATLRQILEHFTIDETHALSLGSIQTSLSCVCGGGCKQNVNIVANRQQQQHHHRQQMIKVSPSRYPFEIVGVHIVWPTPTAEFEFKIHSRILDANGN